MNKPSSPDLLNIMKLTGSCDECNNERVRLGFGFSYTALEDTTCYALQLDGHEIWRLCQTHLRRFLGELEAIVFDE